MNFRIREICEKRGVKLYHIGKHIFPTHPHSIYDVMSGRATISMKRIGMIAKFLKVSVSELFTNDKEK